MSVALITGACGDLGTAVARRLAADGHRVALNDHPDRDATGLAGELDGITAPADVTDPAAVEAMVTEVERRMEGGIAILVAASVYVTAEPFDEHDLDDWWRNVDVNLGGAFACAQAVLPGMVERGGGRMVLLSSEWGLQGHPNLTAFSASEAGLVALTKSLGRELAPLGIVVNAVATGVVDTSRLDSVAKDAGMSPEELRTDLGGRVPLGRVATPEEIADAVAFLADSRLPTLIGQIMQVNGGSTMTRV